MVFFQEKRYVEALEDGKIVRVSEDYAKREGLFILRKDVVEKKEEEPQPTFRLGSQRKKPKEESKLLFDDFRKPLNWRKHQVISELIDNFHWEILKARKARGETRKQTAQAVGVSENDIKMLENGLLPSNDFVLINKVQNYFGINLRKDKKDFSNEARRLVKYDDKKAGMAGKSGDESILGKDIEIDDGSGIG